MATKQLKRSKRVSANKPTDSKGLTGFLVVDILILLLSGLLMLTYLNPTFLKDNLSSSNNSTHMSNHINRQFVKLSNSIADENNQLSAKLLKESQTNEVVNDLVDYISGIHGFRGDSLAISSTVKNTLVNVIDDKSSNKAKKVKTIIQENDQTSQYAILSSFDLDAVTNLGNVMSLMWIISIGIFLIGLIMLIVWINKMRKAKLKTLHFLKLLFSTTLYLGLVLTILFTTLAVVTSLFDFSTIVGEFSGIIIQYSSPLLFNVVLVGVGLFIFSFIPLAITNSKLKQ